MSSLSHGIAELNEQTFSMGPKLNSLSHLGQGSTLIPFIITQSNHVDIVHFKQKDPHSFKMCLLG